jgi:hypothetical protein
MKKFFWMILLVSVFFTGLGGMLQETTAKFKSDEKALALLQKARQAIGGETGLAGVNSLIVTGKSTRTFKFDGVDRTEQGDMELALQFPDKMMKIVKMGHNDGAAAGEKTVNKQVDVVIVRNGDGNAQWKSEDGNTLKLDDGTKFLIKKEDGTTEEVQASSNTKFVVKKTDGNSGEVQVEAQPNGGRQMIFNRVAEGQPGEFPWQLSGLARTALSLLLTAPQGIDVTYLYGGEESVDGTACNIINAQFKGTAIRLYLGKDSNLPVMMAYQGEKMPMMIWRTKKDEAGAPDAGKDVKVFTRKIEAPEMAEFQVKFSDYRSVNGMLLPYKWVQTIGGLPDETTEVSSYEINPANIADKFKSRER